jgi:hypothetical protein
MLPTPWAQRISRRLEANQFFFGLRIVCRCIHLDPVVPYARFDLFPVHIGNDPVGALDRHVAIDAVLSNLCAKLQKFAAVSILMALQAFF